METNNEYKGLLGCFPDTIAVHKVRQEVEELHAGSLGRSFNGRQHSGIG